MTFTSAVHLIRPGGAEVPTLQIRMKDRMNIHKNDRLTPLGLERTVRSVLSGQTPEPLVAQMEALSRRRWTDKQNAFTSKALPFNVSVAFHGATPTGGGEKLVERRQVAAGRQRRLTGYRHHFRSVA